MGKIIKELGIFVLITGFISNLINRILKFSWDYMLSRFMIKVQIKSYELIAAIVDIADQQAPKNSKFFLLQFGSGKPRLRSQEPFMKLTYKGKQFFIFHRPHIEKGGMEEDVAEQLYLYTSYRNREFIEPILEEIHEEATRPKFEEVNIYSNSLSGWAFNGVIPARHQDTIILPKGELEDFIEDLQDFIDSKDWYNKHSIPYSRGYLLHGIPGAGKTSLIKFAASHFQCNIYNLRLSSWTIGDSLFSMLMNNLPGKCIVLIEDIDCVFATREIIMDIDPKEGKSQPKENISLSTLLNTLDGIGSPQGRIIFMTTNHLDRLDPALVRPGRADYIMSFSSPTIDQIYRFLERFYITMPGTQLQELAEKMHCNIPDCSIALIQKYVQRFKEKGDDLYNFVISGKEI